MENRPRGCVTYETKEILDMLWPKYGEALFEYAEAESEAKFDVYERGLNKGRNDAMAIAEFVMAGICTVLAVRCFKWYKAEKKKDKK